MSIMKKNYMDIDSAEAMQIMKELRHTLSPLTTLFLLMDYTSAEIEASISKISREDMARLDRRYNNTGRLLDRHWQQMIRFEEPESEASKRLKKTYTIIAAAKEIGVSIGTVRNAIKSGKLKYSNVSGLGVRVHARISQKDIDEYKKHKK
jgi:hypothetical protein